MNAKWIARIAIGLVCAWGSASPAAVKPTKEQKTEIQSLISATKAFQSIYDMCRKNEKDARESGDAAAAEAWAGAAAALRNSAKALGDKAIEKTDEHYGIAHPPNTTIEYDPDCDDYAYVPKPKTKKDIKVIICPAALSDGPGLLASTKMHELEHAWQVYICYSSLPGFWEDCTFWGHWAERQAYDVEERAYDACITSDMPKSEKELIKKRRAAHQKAMDRLEAPILWLEPNIEVSRAEIVNVPFLLHNPTSELLVFDIAVSDEKGWLMPAPPIVGLPLPPEQDYLGVAVLQAPPTAETRSVNALSVRADCGPTSSSDVLMAYIPPDIRVEPGPPAGAARGFAAPVVFTVSNHGSAPVPVVAALDNPLGFPMSVEADAFTLLPAGSRDILTEVTVPGDFPATFTKNLIFCQASAASDPSQTDTKYVPLEILELDLAALAILSPLPGNHYEANIEFTPAAAVMNAGRIDSFFDVFFQIEQGGAPQHSQTISVPGLAPGAMQIVNFAPLSLPAIGDYTARVAIQLPGDANSANDLAETSFAISPQTGARRWSEY